MVRGPRPTQWDLRVPARLALVCQGFAREEKDPNGWVREVLWGGDVSPNARVQCIHDGHRASKRERRYRVIEFKCLCGTFEF
jgi:non-ribosomal peptide synthetase component F